MSKGKYKRKKEHAHQEEENGGAHSVAHQTKSQDETQDGANRERPSANKKQEHSMRPGELANKIGQIMRSAITTNWLLVAFTAALAFSAIYQFWIMDRQLDVMRKDERAWLSIKQKTGTTIALNVAPWTDISISNIGKTPAINLVGHFYVELVPNGQGPHFEQQVMHTTMVSGVILPNDFQEVHVVRKNPTTTETGDDPISEPEWKDWSTGNSWLAVHGIVWYNDIFHVRHWARFCFWADAKPGNYSSQSCTTYNAVDEK